MDAIFSLRGVSFSLFIPSMGVWAPRSQWLVAPSPIRKARELGARIRVTRRSTSHAHGMTKGRSSEYARTYGCEVSPAWLFLSLSLQSVVERELQGMSAALSVASRTSPIRKDANWERGFWSQGPAPMRLTSARAPRSTVTLMDLPLHYLARWRPRGRRLGTESPPTHTHTHITTRDRVERGQARRVPRAGGPDHGARAGRARSSRSTMHITPKRCFSIYATSAVFDTCHFRGSSLWRGSSLCASALAACFLVSHRSKRPCFDSF